MSERDDGGPAFPRPYSQHDSSNKITASFETQDGMSVRDYAAIHFSAAYMANASVPGDFAAKIVAGIAAADRFIKERKQ